MMGSNDKPQDELFYAFNLDDVVSRDHLLRDIDRLLDFTELREHLAPYYSHTGRHRWFCKLSITDKVPDHSTFSKNRHGRFREAEAFRFVFERVLKCCMDEGLIGGEGFAVDASVVKADASKQKHHEDDDDDWGGGSRAMNEYRSGLQHRVVLRTTPTRPTTWWIPRPALSWMWKRRRRYAHRRCGQPRP
jgi:transposase